MQLLKLSYISHGFTLALLDKPLADEYAEAWKFGPVLHSIYHEFKYEKPGRITEKAKRANMIKNRLENFVSDFDKNEKTIMELTHENMENLTAGNCPPSLIPKTPPGIRHGKMDNTSEVFSISNKEIQEHYKALIENSRRNS